MTRFSSPRAPLGTDPVREFRSVEESLNTWLRDRALSNERAGNSRTFVSVDIDTGLVAGYYCLCASALVHDDANAALKRNSPNPIPVILIGRLAVDERYEGVGLGRSLLRDALSKAVTAARIVGARAVIVHALNESAAAFYEKYGFATVPHGERVMYMLMSDIEKSLGELPGEEAHETT
ncbi:MAG: hypothetical protein BGN97_14430 [Microbacterium sp. 69-10]|uniref:GNAT family N-acetyltransferase n=1 Tax=Microbacterium sp. 69-10 TaxID=1895783 RepID=UPI00095A3F14|nr:GNAT family N-acetyltransferase [Microbacterium sp. 69-10]OJU39998.1 MAG: hypothetical protein BGN97_14430 [Microbacterium sp. 69-10]